MLDLNDIYTCIQGEGCQTGLAMVLVRLHGCGVGCPFCDTKETWQRDRRQLVGSIEAALGANERWTKVAPAIILDHIQRYHSGPRWLLITGGEPADQYLPPLVDAAHAAGYKVAIETSGTARGHLGAAFDWICVSPKIGMPGGRHIDPDVLQSAHEIKAVIGRQRDLDQLDDLLTQTPVTAQICLQPISQNMKATALCIKTVQERGWRLSIQTHKYLQLP